MARAKPTVNVNEPPVRVVQLLGAAKAGGAETFFVRLMLALARRPERVAVLPIVRRGSWAAARLREMGVAHETAGFGGWWDLPTRWKVARLTRAFKADVVMGWMNRATAVVPQGPWARCARLGGYYKFKYYINKVNYLIGNTEDLCGYLRTGWDAARVAHIGNFAPEPEAGWREGAARLRRDLKISPKARVVLMAARLHPVKGWDVALKVLAGLGKDVVLVVLGEGREKEGLMALAKDLGVDGQVRWAGWADSVSPYVALADVWLVASRHEPLGNSVLDAWAHGVPLVATRSQGPLQLMTDGKDGLLVPIDDVGAMTAAVLGVLKDGKLAAKLAAGGQAALAKDFSEEVIVGKFIAYYQGLKKEGVR